MALEEVKVAQQLVFSGEGRLAGAHPLLPPAVLLVRLQVRHHRELLGAALAARSTRMQSMQRPVHGVFASKQTITAPADYSCSKQPGIPLVANVFVQLRPCFGTHP